MMNKAREFDNILDECLERILTKGESTELCLGRYPEHAAELEPLLRTALDTKEAAAIKPRPEFRERAGYQFQAALRETESKESRGLFGWQPRWATALIVVIVLLLASSGTVAAANNSLPDEPLYQVKLATEAVRLTLTPSAMGKAELYARLVDKRVDEIIKMADKGKAEQVERAARRLNTQLIAMASLAIPGREAPVEMEAATLEAEPPMMAAEEAPQAQVKEALPAPVEEVPIVSAPRAPGPPESAGQGRGLGRGNEDVKPGKRAQLRMELSHQAVENSQALQAVLERATESVKPALRQAIEVAGAGYEQALRNLD